MYRRNLSSPRQISRKCSSKFQNQRLKKLLSDLKTSRARFSKSVGEKTNSVCASLGHLFMGVPSEFQPPGRGPLYFFFVIFKRRFTLADSLDQILNHMCTSSHEVHGTCTRRQRWAWFSKLGSGTLNLVFIPRRLIGRCFRREISVTSPLLLSLFSM